MRRDESRDPAHLLDIAHAARKIGTFVRGLDEAAFLRDEKTQAAVAHEFMILGEAANRLSDAFRDRHREVAWHEMIGMRNLLIHEYDRVNLQRVWTAATGAVPRLLSWLEPRLPKDEA